MKKITLLIVALFFSFSGSAQFSEDFEGVFPPPGWTIETTAADNTWIEATGIDAITGKSAFVEWTNNEPQDESLITPVLAIPAASSLFFDLSMSYFWAILPNDNYDFLVSISTDGGDIYTEIWDETELGVFPNFIPFNVQIDLAAYAGQTNVRIKFNYFGLDGANLALDNIAIAANIPLIGCATNFMPMNMAVNVPLGAFQASWTAPTPGASPTSYDLFAGTSATDLELVDNYIDTNTGTDFTLEVFNETTFWQIVPRNDGGPAVGCPVNSFTTVASPGFCLNSPNGQWPTAVFTPAVCDGLTDNLVTEVGFTGEYSLVNVVNGQSYIFKSFNATSTDFITISTDAGLTAAVFGVSPLTWVSNFTGEIRFYSHEDNQCGFETVNRSRIVVCGVPAADLPDYVNLQFPATATFAQGGSTLVYGQVYEAGLTDAVPNIAGQAPGINAWIGISPVGANTNPNLWTSWTVATHNAGAIGNNDEYEATIGANLVPGTYYYASRFNLNGGAFVYGGTSNSGGNFWDGTTSISGVLTVTAPITPANDECANAVVLTAGGTFAQNVTNATNLAATLSANPVPTTCLGFNGGDVWFSVVVPASGNITIETGNPTTGGSGLDTVVTAYSGTCGALVQIGCDDDGAATAAYSLLSLTNQTPGAVILIRAYEYLNDNFGGFGISAYDASLSTNTFDSSTFSYYPNPVKNTLNLAYSQNISNVEVFNLLGQSMVVSKVDSTTAQVDMSQYPSGVYLVKVTSNTATKTVRVIKE